jgi:hypothetical protein
MNKHETQAMFDYVFGWPSGGAVTEVFCDQHRASSWQGWDFCHVAGAGVQVTLTTCTGKEVRLVTSPAEFAAWRAAQFE